MFKLRWGVKIICAQFGTEVEIYYGMEKGWNLKLQNFAMPFPKKDY